MVAEANTNYRDAKSETRTLLRMAVYPPLVIGLLMLFRVYVIG